MVKNTVDFKSLERKVMAGISLYGKTASARMESKAKREAPWTDRTTDARGSIQGGFTWQGRNALVTISGNMDYSPKLELAHGKRYAILTPTVEAMTKEVLSGFAKLVG